MPTARAALLVAAPAAAKSPSPLLLPCDADTRMLNPDHRGLLPRRRRRRRIRYTSTSMITAVPRTDLDNHYEHSSTSATAISSPCSVQGHASIGLTQRPRVSSVPAPHQLATLSLSWRPPVLCER
ncbi:hypothetical protein M0R45_025879 [Rubus argutus]|uniref:Secreted protein n=1 Tax=Rubus argutus TaxID=59490 RepID=A0AAW1WXC0_RUBAR